MTLPSWTRFAFFAAGTGLALRAAPISDQPAPEREATGLVFANPHHDPYDPQNGRGFNHAPSLAVLPNGQLISVWFSGPYEGAVEQVILGSTSADGGRTWAPAQLMAQRRHESQFDPALLRDGKRLWFFHSSGRWNKYPPVGPQTSGRAKVGAESFRIYGAYSDDSGATWSEPRIIYDVPAWNCRSNGIVLKSGEYVLPVHNLGDERGAASLVSADRGATWKRSTTVVFPSPHLAEEPSIAQLPSGQLLMVLRTHDGSLWFARSADHGQIWAQAEKSTLVGAESSANLLALQDGRLLLTYDQSAPPRRSPLVMRLSDDGGRTWGQAGQVATAPAGPAAAWSVQASYPSVVELDQGRVAAVWASLVLSPTDLYGEIRSARLKIGRSP